MLSLCRTLPWLKVLLLMLSFSADAETYRVQVGDLIKVQLPGEPSLDRPFNVDRQGRVSLPEVGAVQVAGITELAMQRRITERMGSVFRDLSSLSVYVDKKQMLISVQGYVKEPGEITLPADGSIQMALHAAGGMRNGAQLNRMQLIRDGKTRHFDYKRYLDSGNRAGLPRLRSLDTLFVPASPMIGNVEVDFDPAKVADAGDAAEDHKAIKVFGEVNSPGSFSYRKSHNLVDLLMRAGGVTRYAGVEQIRIITQGEPILFNLKQYLNTGNERLLPTIRPGTTLFVPRQEEEIKTGANMVYVMGEVAKPGAYEGKEEATFMDILANAGGPTRFAESRQIRVIKSNGRVIPFDLTGYTEGTLPSRPPAIAAGDAIFIPEKSDLNEKSWLKVAPNRAVRVIGEVVRPGRIEWSQEMSLLDLLAHVGGPTSRADTRKIDVVAPNRDGSVSTHQFDLDTFIKEGRSDRDLPTIRAGATVRVHDLPVDPSDNKAQWIRQTSDRSIYVFGQVGAPGRYRFTDQMTFLDILSAADGPTANADIHNIRISHHDGKHARVSKVDLALYFETGDLNLIPEVRIGDTIYIPEKDRLWLTHAKETTVRLIGAVHKPGRYHFDDSMTLLDLLAEGGGTRANADVARITVVNLSCCRDQARRFDLSAFSRTARFDDLPVVRAGDTVYIPDKSESLLSKVRGGLRDLFEVVSLGALLGLL